MNNSNNTTLVPSIGTNLNDIGTLIQRLGRIQNALKVADDSTISVCHIVNTNTTANIERLLDPELDEAVDMEVSTAFTNALRSQARTLLAQLESYGITLDDALVSEITEDDRL